MERPAEGEAGWRYRNQLACEAEGAAPAHPGGQDIGTRPSRTVAKEARPRAQGLQGSSRLRGGRTLRRCPPPTPQEGRCGLGGAVQGDHRRVRQVACWNGDRPSLKSSTRRLSPESQGAEAGGAVEGRLRAPAAPWNRCSDGEARGLGSLRKTQRATPPFPGASGATGPALGAVPFPSGGRGVPGHQEAPGVAGSRFRGARPRRNSGHLGVLVEGGGVRGLGNGEGEGAHGLRPCGRLRRKECRQGCSVSKGCLHRGLQVCSTTSP
jgi:hypothetical protein